MSTKFILHGGFSKDKLDEDNSLFYSEILKDSSLNPKILLIPFAKDEDRIIPATQKISREFQNVANGKVLTIDIATKDSFIDQLKNSEIVYFHGGTSTNLLNALTPFGDISEYLQEKIVAGESAGANILCTYFYSPHADKVLEGLRILPIRLIPHYNEAKKNKLDGYGDDMETLLLPEYEFTVLVK